MANVALGESVVHRDPEIMGGEPVFVGTRVPVQALIDTMRSGRTLDEFLEHFPTVERAQVMDFLQQATQAMVERAA
ncbi:DUF433 domain-containing protein [Longimicrobium sp.]|uniref:DUF433 domain-containing protein n=1 Tax=Longimicrobium sp. TaxID=2029185 RepID=UPI002C53CFFD|nr:DUF433 domain-containing protein [Longimicrobium sp.]HSU14060.1 DUF433 domain-containing protein [Longimicrobium sp.]